MLSVLPAACVIVLCAFFIFGSDAAPLTKTIVGILAAVSFLIRILTPGAWIVSLLLQVFLSIGILLYMQVNPKVRL